MPERNIPGAATPPADWHQAFAALPLEAPRQDRWPAIAAALPDRQRRQQRRPWALAAAIACLAALPALHLLRQPPPGTREATAEATAPGGARPATAPPARAESADPASALPGPVVAFMPAPGAAAGEMPAAASADAGLQPLQDESARLERLLDALAIAQPRDGVQLALAASLQAQVAGIDEALAAPVLDDGARAGLWQQRVEVLRELAGLAAEQRWQALYGGDAPEYALVQVY